MKTNKKEKEKEAKKIRAEDIESLESKYEDKETVEAISRYIG